MPYAEEHTARVNNPGKYSKFRRQNNKFGPGVDVVWGIKSDGTVEAESIRFDASKFTAEQALKWLKDHADEHPDWANPEEFIPARR